MLETNPRMLTGRHSRGSLPHLPQNAAQLVTTSESLTRGQSRSTPSDPHPQHPIHTEVFDSHGATNHLTMQFFHQHVPEASSQLFANGTVPGTNLVQPSEPMSSDLPLTGGTLLETDTGRLTRSHARDLLPHPPQHAALLVSTSGSLTRGLDRSTPSAPDPQHPLPYEDLDSHRDATPALVQHEPPPVGAKPPKRMRLTKFVYPTR